MGIEFQAVGKSYPDGTRAVGDFSLVIPSRTTTVLVGSSGCGKTTLLRMINRMVEPTSGQVLIDDVDVSTREPVELRRSIGYVMQHAGLLPHRRVIDNVATPLRLGGVPRAEARERARAALERVGLAAEHDRKYPAQLSGGQQQRVGVARGLVTDPNILLMDEPFGAVDPIVRDDLQRQLRVLQGELGKTIVFVTHDIDEALFLGDQIVILRTGGEVAQVGTPAEILAEPADDFVRSFVGLDKAKRRLRVEQIDGRQAVIDEDGRVTGLLT
ncbi:ABC transporter ATP-binding protein [Nocardioides sp. Kera G14]|uniref:ABC transporter ATP-binding protein n=1 Tax=Nocardioides sp. Kera G14 TaxID=2884264 RepID=UPI001D124942|nr:ATP-binding cassette domain-containing protein [Nocardioides sp. Kera G14]UDY24454.1 ATP-binding cassette domain-containing protein [Nocardioides sp. Kera G14]